MGDPLLSEQCRWCVPPIMVIDTSMIMRYFFEDEKNREAAEAVFESMEGGNCIGVVPAMWGVEVANVLVAAVRNERLKPEDVAEISESLTKLPFVSDSETHRHALTATLAMAKQYGLKAQDASFLELAQRLGISLATYDEALSDAAVEAEITVFPPRLP